MLGIMGAITIVEILSPGGEIFEFFVGEWPTHGKAYAFNMDKNHTHTRARGQRKQSCEMNKMNVAHSFLSNVFN